MDVDGDEIKEEGEEEEQSGEGGGDASQEKKPATLQKIEDFLLSELNVDVHMPSCTTLIFIQSNMGPIS